MRQNVAATLSTQYFSEIMIALQNNKSRQTSYLLDPKQVDISDFSSFMNTVTISCYTIHINSAFSFQLDIVTQMIIIINHRGLY